VEWLERFNFGCAVDAPLFTLDDVMLIGDMYYLPFELGERAAAYLQTAQSVITRKQAALLTQLQTESDAIQRVYVKLTSMHHRELCYTLYRFVWDAKEEADVIGKFGTWLHASPDADGTVHFRVFAVLVTLFAAHVGCIQVFNRYGVGSLGVGSPFAIPGPIRGGFVAATQRVVVFDNDSGLFRLPHSDS
jgi:hypothetical protein